MWPYALARRLERSAMLRFERSSPRGWRRSEGWRLGVRRSPRSVSASKVLWTRRAASAPCVIPLRCHTRHPDAPHERHASLPRISAVRRTAAALARLHRLWSSGEPVSPLVPDHRRTPDPGSSSPAQLRSPGTRPPARLPRLGSPGLTLLSRKSSNKRRSGGGRLSSPWVGVSRWVTHSGSPPPASPGSPSWITLAHLAHPAHRVAPRAPAHPAHPGSPGSPRRHPPEHPTHPAHPGSPCSPWLTLLAPELRVIRNEAHQQRERRPRAV